MISLIPAATALGINCRGSHNCLGGASIAQSLTAFISDIDQGRWYENGEHIACDITVVVDSGSSNVCTCAFLQNTGGAWGSDILRLAHYISDHGCQACGSVPYFYPSDNDVRHGELTYNYVSSCTTNGLS
jgi:hypothetical protein